MGALRGGAPYLCGKMDSMRAIDRQRAIAHRIAVEEADPFGRHAECADCGNERDTAHHNFGTGHVFVAKTEED